MWRQFPRKSRVNVAASPPLTFLEPGAGRSPRLRPAAERATVPLKNFGGVAHEKDSYIAKGYLFKKRGYYHMRVYWYDANGKCPPKDRNTKIKVNEHKKREAEKKLKSFICEVQKELDRQRELAEQAALPLSGKNFLTELESYLDGPIKDKVRDNTYYEYKRAYEGHIMPYGGFQKATVGQITPEVLDAYRDTLLNEGLSPNSVNKILPIMRQFFSHYCNKHQLTTNPFDNFAPPRKVKFKGQQFYTAD